MSPLAALRSLADRFGGLGLAALACLGLALVLQATLSRTLTRQRDALQDQVSALQNQLRISGPKGPSRDDSAAAQLTRFYAGFPNVQTATDWLRQVQKAALRSGIVLQAGEYRLEQRSGERLQRYAITLPVSGSYAQIRAFIDAVLAPQPS